MARPVQLGAMPVSAAAKRLGVTPARVYQMIDEGKLTSVKIDKTVLVFESAVTWAETMRRGEVRNAA